MLIDDRNVVALPERVKLSPEREQDALRHQACSTARPCLADRPARRRRLLHPRWRQGLPAGATSTAAIAAPVPMPPVRPAGWRPGHAPNCSSDNSPKERDAVQGSCYWLVRARDDSEWPWQPVRSESQRTNRTGKSLANSGCRLLGVQPAGCWTRPELRCCGGAPRRNRTGDPILTMNLAPTAVRTCVSAGRRRP
jgi:hypothetical protein